MAKSKKYTEIRQDLLDQLDRNRTYGKYYTDLIEDYMALWETKNKLLKDINKRGVSLAYNNGGGQKGFKKNDSIEQSIKVNMQMLKILDALGIKPTMYSGGDDEDEEL